MWLCANGAVGFLSALVEPFLPEFLHLYNTCITRCFGRVVLISHEVKRKTNAVQVCKERKGGQGGKEGAFHGLTWRAISCGEEGGVAV